MTASPAGAQDIEPVDSKEVARRRIHRISYWSLPFIVLFVVGNLIPNLPDAWRFALLAIEAVFLFFFGRAVIRFSLWQRDEYWRERRRDPKHPERFPKDRSG